MNDATKAAFAAMSQEVLDLHDEVDAALEEHATFASQLDARERVDTLAHRYRELLASLPDEAVRDGYERTLGRKIVDLQKGAASLPARTVGKPAEKMADTSFFATRAGTSSRQPVQPGAGAIPPSERGKYRVTGEVDAWCGPCDDVKSHVIAAMVGDQPAQVVCQACGSRHKFRTGPAKKAAEKKAAATPLPSRPTAAQMDTERRERARSTLIDSLRAAENVRSYSPKDRYKTGEIIEHPEHGRGKIENILPRSMLVRFAGGLRSVKLG